MDWQSMETTWWSPGGTPMFAIFRIIERDDLYTHAKWLCGVSRSTRARSLANPGWSNGPASTAAGGRQ